MLIGNRIVSWCPSLVVLPDGARAARRALVVVLAAPQHPATLVRLVVAHEPIKLKLLSIPDPTFFDNAAVTETLDLGGVHKSVVEVNQHVAECEHKERNREQNENVGDVIQLGAVDEHHLLFRSAHEEEACRV